MVDKRLNRIIVAHTYQAASRQLLAQGREELADGDVRQASEKGWGAAAQIVKAIAAQRGWEHRNHAALFDAISFLVAETRDHEIRRLFHVANALRINISENWDNAANVSSALEDLERFLYKLEPLVSAE